MRTMHGSELSSLDVLEIVRKNLQGLKVQSGSVIPESLRCHYKTWYEDYPKVDQVGSTLVENDVVVPGVALVAGEQLGMPPEGAELALKNKRDADIDTLLDAVIAHLSLLEGVDEAKLLAFSADKKTGLLRQNLQTFSLDDDIIIYMQELLQYVHLLTEASEQERSTRLEDFPAALGTIEYNCLEGTRDRLQQSLAMMTLKDLSAQDQRLINAHKEVVEEHRIKFRRFVIDTDQQHLAGGIEYLYGIDDKSKHLPRVVSMSVSMEEAWQAVRGYADHLNDALEAQQRWGIKSESREITEFLNRNYTDRSGLIKDWIGAELTLDGRGIKASDIVEEVYLESRQEYANKWNDAQIVEVVSKLPQYSGLKISSPYTLDIPTSLFDSDAPKQVSNLIRSGDSLHRDFGIKALLLMGHEGQMGSSPIQFLNTINELGKSSVIEETKEQDVPTSFVLGNKFLQGLKDSEELELTDNIDLIIGRINHYQNQSSANKTCDMSSYITYLSGGAALLPSVFFNGNANLGLIQKDLYPVADRLWGAIDFQRLLCNPECDDIVRYMIRENRLRDSSKEQVLEILLHESVAQCNTYMIKAILHYLQEVSGEGLGGDYIINRVCKALSSNGAKGLNNLAEFNAKLFVHLISPNSSESGKAAYYDLFASLDREGRTVIHNLALRGDAHNLQIMFDLFPFPIWKNLLDNRDQFGITALHCASQNGHALCVELLLSLGADPLVKSRLEGSWMALHIAAAHGHKEVLSALLSLNFEKAKILIDTPDTYGHTALLIASESGHALCVELLLSLGDDQLVQARNYLGRTAVHLAALQGHRDVLSFLLPGHIEEAKILVDTLDTHGYTSLMNASQNGHVLCVELLLSLGADPLLQDRRDGVTALHIAASKGHMEVLSALLSDTLGEAKISVDSLDAQGNTALMIASSEGHVLCVELLLSLGADPLVQDRKEGFTALHLAAYKGRVEVLSMLLSTDRDGIKVSSDIRDVSGCSAFSAALILGSVSSMERLLELGVFPEKGECSADALSLAVRSDRADLLKVLLPSYRLSAGSVTPNVLDENGCSPLMVAVERGYYSCVTALLETGHCYNLGMTTKNDFESRITMEVEKYQKCKDVARSIVRLAASQCWAACDDRYVFTSMSNESEDQLEEVSKVIYYQLVLLYKADISQLHLDFGINPSNANHTLNDKDLRPMAEQVASYMQLEDNDPIYCSLFKDYRTDIDGIAHLFQNREEVRNLNSKPIAVGGRGQDREDAGRSVSQTLMTFVRKISDNCSEEKDNIKH